MWLKAFHLIFMVTWFAGLFYLPRLFVYHAMTSDAPGIARFKIMERKLFWGITTPAMVLTLIFGVWMLADYDWALYGTSRWLHLKLTLVGFLVGYHVLCWQWLRDFAEDRNSRSHLFYRWVNEVPVLFLFAIILLASLKPF
ncbi:MAG: protoporphyrinogen oxidase HemJ [Methylococcus sp.]|nr:protoporphyrinogen oxidase HemJ [Methylococcus sp.]